MTYLELIKHNGASVTENALEKRARRMAAGQNKTVTKPSPRSRWYNTYGPFMIADSYNIVETWGIQTIEDVINYLAED